MTREECFCGNCRPCLRGKLIKARALLRAWLEAPVLQCVTPSGNYFCPNCADWFRRNHAQIHEYPVTRLREETEQLLRVDGFPDT